jgi:glycyl-tRNA synthetase beta chain
MSKNLLFEIGCAELPAKNLWGFTQLLRDKIAHELTQSRLQFKDIQLFATPRRLAFLIKNLSLSQSNKTTEKRGPALNAPESAINGFAKSVGVEKNSLSEKQGYYFYSMEEQGQTTQNILPQLLNRALSNLSNIKTMRWGNHSTLFVRPVYWTVLLFGEEEIQANLLGTTSSRQTYGHRFHYPLSILLNSADSYADCLLEEGLVRADFEKRKEYIGKEVVNKANLLHGRVLLDETLLDEVTGLVEYPVVLTCEFSKEFLQVPQEALISSIQQHQKCFAIIHNDDDARLLPYFITVSNIKSTNAKTVIGGNERVMHARLSDALFFYAQDKKVNLGEHLLKLKNVIFQQKLGSMGDKVERLVVIAEKIGERLKTDKLQTKRAAILCKADLMTQMVKEFPELQGIMGYYYAKSEGEAEEVALGIREHYLPRSANDKLPKSPIGCTIALADRFDSLNRIFSINAIPTGEKDPFGLRRAAFGIIRIIIEKELDNIYLSDFCESETVKNFILDRLKHYYQDNDLGAAYLQAALEVQQNNLSDLNRRIQALKSFTQLPEAKSLIEANKRVKNILKKNNIDNKFNQHDIDIKLFDKNKSVESKLYQKILDFPHKDNSQNYIAILQSLADFRELVDQFFTEIIVEADDLAVKNNRLILLYLLRDLFLKVADISLIAL